MKLHYRKLGEGPAFIILHGLFGLSDNWQSVAKKLSERFTVYLVDLRNHGHSAHHEEWNYNAMAEDVYELIGEEGLEKVIILGHSMGGKTAMTFAEKNCSKLDKLIVVDIALRAYDPPRDVIRALNSVDLDEVKSRKEVEELISFHIDDIATRQFLLKNLYWVEDNKLGWRFNLPVITKKVENIATSLKLKSVCDVKALFIHGDRSNYIKDSDTTEILNSFPNAEFKSVENAGHWVHAENPAGFMAALEGFLGN